MSSELSKKCILVTITQCFKKHIRVSTGLAILFWANMNYANNNDWHKREAVHSHITKSVHRIEKGHITSEIENLNHTLKQVKMSGDINNQVYTLGVLSDARLLSGFTEHALELAHEAVDLSKNIDDSELKANALNYLGNAYAAQRRFAKAQQNYQEAARFAQQARNNKMEISVLINQLHVLISTDNVQAAELLIQQTSKKISKLPPEHRLHDLNSIGYLTQHLLQQSVPSFHKNTALKEIAFLALNEAKMLAQQQKDKPSESMALGYLAELYTLDNRYQEALQLFQQALFLSLESDVHYLSGRWHWRLGWLHTQTNENTKAISSYFNALALLKTIQPESWKAWRGYHDTFANSVGVVYTELTQLLLEKANNSSNIAARQSTLKDIRTVMEEYKAVELKEYFQDSCVTEQLAQNKNIELDDLISQGTAVLHPIMFPDRTVLLLSLTNGEIHSMTVPVNYQQIEREANEFRSLMNPSGNPRQMRKLSISLYNKLIRPLQTSLEKNHIKNLVIVPEGVLRTIPFAALHDGEQYLINQYSVAISPGLSLTDTSSPKKSSRNIFAAGLSEGVQGFSRLPYVKREIENISELYNSKKILDKNFTTSNVLSELGSSNYEWVTLSTHGYIDRHFNQSFLLTYDDKLTFGNLETAFQSSKTKDQHVDLLVLSACETAVGDERAALGLAGLALKAGVKSTMASLWTVNDQYTSLLIPEFFNQLKHTGISKAQALQAAQLHLINEHEAIHPYYWAAFVIAGNWM